MKRKIVKRMMALLLVAASLTVTACGAGGDGDKAKDSKKAEDGVAKISLYPGDANLSSGVVSGHKGEFFKENGIELEVWAYSDEKTNAILASGDLPDIMYVTKENLDTMIEAGMLLDLEPYLDKIPHLKDNEFMEPALDYVREYRSAGTDKLYGLPLAVGDMATKVTRTDAVDRNTVKLRWDVYEQIGAPAINNYDDLIDVMEQMKEAQPEDESGNPFYGTILNAGSDATFWNNMTLWYRWQGYEEYNLPYLLEADMVNGTYSSILEKDSMYYKGLKWYNEVYRRGLMDPDSINSDRATQAAKVTDGYAMVPGGSLPGWAPKYFEYYIPDTNVYFDYNRTYGDENKVIAINANTKNVDACLKLLDMWCDADSIFRLLNGPDGDLWYSDGDKAYLSEDYLAYIQEHEGSYQGFKYEDGEEVVLWNTPFCINFGTPTSWKDADGNPRISRVEQWPEVMDISTNNDTFANWKKTTGHETYKEWLEAEDAYTSESPLKNVLTFCSLPDDSMQLTVDAIKDKVVNASWKMVYAESEEEFDSLWSQMVSDCEGLGAADVIKWRQDDIKNATKLRDSLEQ